jgi:hypothetical protein
MSQSGASGSQNNSEKLKEAKLPWRDWLLLPLLCLLTLVLLAVSTELAARWLFPTSQAGLENCFGKHPTGDAPVIPNSVCWERTEESKFVVEYKFNSLGHRAGMERDPKTPGAYRIVMIGSSMAMGLFVPREMTFAALLPQELSQQTGRKIELYNEASGGEFRGGPYPVRNSASDFKDVLAAHPDMILWVVTPNDFENASLDETAVKAAPQSPAAGPVSDAKPGLAAKAWNKLKVTVANGTLGDEFRNQFDKTRTSMVLKHLLYGSESQQQYVTSYLKNEEDAGFLRAEPNARWQHLLTIVDSNAAAFEQQAKDANVPFVTALVPNRAQAAMVSMGKDAWPAGYNPYKLDGEMRAIIERHGGTYVDVLPEFAKIPNPERHYFPVDGHPDAEGQAMIADILTQGLTSGTVPALKAQAQTERGR